MIKSTVAELLNDSLDEQYRESVIAPHHLYLVRDGDVILYIGMSEDVIGRLLSHLGEDHWGRLSLLGRLIETNIPESFDWQIELLTLDDCLVYINRDDLPEYLCSPNPRRTMDYVKFYEEYLIAALHPCLNSTHNSNPTRLPAHYHAYISREAVKEAFFKHTPSPQQWAESNVRNVVKEN